MCWAPGLKGKHLMLVITSGQYQLFCPREQGTIKASRFNNIKHNIKTYFHHNMLETCLSFLMYNINTVIGFLQEKNMHNPTFFVGHNPISALSGDLVNIRASYDCEVWNY